MNWGSRYSDSIFEDPLLEPVTGVELGGVQEKGFPQVGVLIGGFGQASVSEVALWRKLVESSLSIQADELWFDLDPDFLKSYLPRSLQSRSYLATALSWELLRERSSFAIVTKPDGLTLAFSGLPTEEGLDRLIDFYRRSAETS